MHSATLALHATPTVIDILLISQVFYLPCINIKYQNKDDVWFADLKFSVLLKLRCTDSIPCCDEVCLIENPREREREREIKRNRKVFIYCCLFTRENV